MPDVSVTITGVDELIRQLGVLEGTKILEPPMQEAIKTLKNGMEKYPDKKLVYPGWKRGHGWADEHGRVRNETSENLQGHWDSKIERTGDGLRGIVGTVVSYARWVQSAQYQNRRLAARGWNKHTDEYILNKYRSNIIRNFQEAIERALRNI